MAEKIIAAIAEQGERGAGNGAARHRNGTAEVSAKQARAAAVNKLRTRISLLREERASLLSVQGARWYRFGFC